MSPRQVELLLQELCVKLGFCLPPKEIVRIEQNPETDIDAFTDDVIRSEGIDPINGISLEFRRSVRAIVKNHFRAAEIDPSISN